MSWLSDALGGQNPYSQGNNPYSPQINQSMGTLQNNANQSWNQTQSMLGGGQNALNQYAQSAMASAMPGLQQSLQQTNENNVARGISTGGLGTSYQGDVYGAFQKNLANSIGQQSMNLYGTQLGANENMYGLNQNAYLNQLNQANNQGIAANKWQNNQNQGFFGQLGGLLGLGGNSTTGTAIGALAGGLF